MFGAIDIGATKLPAAGAGDALRPGPAVRRPTPPDHAIETLAAMLDEARGGARLDGIAVATPGPFDRERGVILNPPNVPAGWLDLPVAGGLSARYGCPVLLENDANCAALAETLYGAAAGLNPLLYSTVSTRIGP